MPSIRPPQVRTRVRVPAPHLSGAAIALTIILTTQLMIILDVAVILTALPKIHTALGFSDTSLSWVQNAYTLTFGGLLLLGARAGDLLGRRRVFVAGIALFTLASMAGGLAQTPAWLLAARTLQGVGSAIAAPSALALLTTRFTEEGERTRAVALYSGVAGGGASVGLVLGGVLTDWASWRWGLFLNVPIGAALIWLAPRHLPETAPRSGRFDLAGAVTSTLGMFALVYGFVRAGQDGWGDDGTIASFVAAVVLLASFVAVERRADQPITPLRLFASRRRTGAYLARMLLVGGMFSMFFFVTQFLQRVHDFSALTAGLAFLPMSLVMFAIINLVPRVQRRVGAAPMLLGGLVLALVAMAWLSRLSVDTAYFGGIALPLAMLGVGIGIALTPLTTAGIAGVAPQDAGAASGLVNVAHQLGGSLGLGILVAVFASAGRHAAAHPLTGASVADEGRYELAHGIAAALTGSAVLLALALLVVVVSLRPPARERGRSGAVTVGAPTS